MAADPREEAVYMAKLAEQAERYSGATSELSRPLSLSRFR